MTWAAISIGGGTALGTGLAGAFGAGKSTVRQIPLETPEQAAARSGLLNFANSGTYGNYTAGTPYTGSLGDFGISALETTGLGQIGANANAGPGAMYNLGSSTLNDLLGTDKYNPLNQKGMISGLTSAIDFNTQQAADATKRNAGFGNSLYSTSTLKNLGNVEAQGANTKATTLAGLYQNYMGQKLGAIPQAFGAQSQLDAQGQQKLQNEMSYGALPRSLNTAADQAKYAEFQRIQQEKAGQIGALSTVSGSSANFGVPSVSIPNNNPWLDVMNSLAQFGGKYAGAAAAK